jgi:hypothetical protein
VVCQFQDWDHHRVPDAFYRLYRARKLAVIQAGMFKSWGVLDLFFRRPSFGAHNDFV